MSPVIFPRGFTRDYIDGKVSSADLIQTIQDAHRTLINNSDFLLCEGTGHTGRCGFEGLGFEGFLGF